MKKHEPKILIWDLETAGVNALKPDLSVIVCFGYKWYGEEETHVKTIDQYPGWFSKSKGLDDLNLVKDSLKVMEDADLLVAHFGDWFDRKFLQGRCALLNLNAPPPTKQRDTWQIARRAFNFSSNRLGNLAISLGLKNQKHQKTRDEWPGWWNRALAGDKQAIKDMAKYCAQDVRTLEEIYTRLRPYDLSHPRMYVDRESCAVCGGVLIKQGFAYVGMNRYQRTVCKSCGRWDRRGVVEK